MPTGDATAIASKRRSVWCRARTFSISLALTACTWAWAKSSEGTTSIDTGPTARAASTASSSSSGLCERSTTWLTPHASAMGRVSGSR